MVVKTPHGDFLPLEALLANLYTSSHFHRPALEVLRELGQRAELTFPNPAIYEEGMLVPKAEAEGFRLLGSFALQEFGKVIAQIGWQPNSGYQLVHACTAEFQLGQDSTLQNEGSWETPGFIGLPHIFTWELQRLAPGGKPIQVFTERGQYALAHRSRHFIAGVEGLPDCLKSDQNLEG
jgi:hypothetical protein